MHNQLDFHHGPGFDDHGSRVAFLATAAGRHMGLRGREIQRLRFAAFVHDIGKTKVDPAILAKQTELADAELAQVREHPRIAHDHLDGIVHPTINEAVLSHHERWDGRGYPNGLRATAIPLHARIIFVADAFDVMTSGRDYRAQLTIAEAGAELTRSAGRQFDPEIVDTFASLRRDALGHFDENSTRPGLLH